MQGINRSYLFVPGSRRDRFAKALRSDAHAVIVDLEDGVAFADKNSARNSVASWLNPTQPVVLRINGAETQWFHDDLALCSMPGVQAVMIAKVENPDAVRMVASNAVVGAAILPQIESAVGMANALELAKCAGVQRLVFGSLDFQADMGINGDDAEVLHFRSHLVFVSRLAGLQPPVDTPATSINSPESLRSDTARVRRLGFGGKLCIHPNQVPIVNECFQPSAEEIAWAKRVIASVADRREGVIALDGKMVDRPVILKAERILNESEREHS